VTQIDSGVFRGDDCATAPWSDRDFLDNFLHCFCKHRFAAEP